MNCPICNKSGLPDFNTIHIICPQCNSDLKVFLIIEGLKKKEQKLKIGRQVYLFIIAVSIISLGLGFSFSWFSNKAPIKIASSSDSLSVYRIQTDIQKHKRLADSIRFSQFKYKIKHGDNLSKIAYSFYNDWTMYKVIQKDNNMGANTRLVVGDSLIINLSRIK